MTAHDQNRTAGSPGNIPLTGRDFIRQLKTVNPNVAKLSSEGRLAWPLAQFFGSKPSVLATAPAMKSLTLRLPNSISPLPNLTVS